MQTLGESASLRHPAKTTHGRSSLRPTVGRHHDLLYVFSTTYRRSFFTPREGAPEAGWWRGEILIY
ncbi:hypothetical protein HMPREF1556_01000 [Porphyromonas sp. oral taxon 278 str. W7784]|nr:hypothetical protein HMPREF1556_01000 [Porphyromonas sp. oral taxon 278 str. W7784]